MTQRLPPLAGLYAITSESLMPPPRFLDKAEAVLRGGCRLLQYRNKSGDAALHRRQARELRALCESFGATLIINDRVELAKQVDAQGVHLGQSDTDLASARRLLGPTAIIGATCHNSMALAQQAQADGADYLAFGRFFPSSTKPDAPPADPALLAQARQQCSLPLVAIGGITRHNALPLLHQGADCLAVSHALFEGDDLSAIEERTRQFVSLFK